MNRWPVEPGCVVVSRCGRDQGRLFAVIREIDREFVLVSDGETRKVDRMKKKRRKHLKPTGTRIAQFEERMESQRPLENFEVRAWLKKEDQ